MTTWKPGAHITVAALRKIDACEETLNRLARRWPAGAAVTLENLIEAQSLGADLVWLVRSIAVDVAVRPAAAVAFDAAETACYRVVSASRSAFYAAQAAYSEAMYALNVSIKASRATHTEAVATANAALATARARIFWQAIGGGNEA